MAYHVGLRTLASLPSPAVLWVCAFKIDHVKLFLMVEYVGKTNRGNSRESGRLDQRYTDQGLIGQLVSALKKQLPPRQRYRGHFSLLPKSGDKDHPLHHRYNPHYIFQLSAISFTTVISYRSCKFCPTPGKSRRTGISMSCKWSAGPTPESISS